MASIVILIILVTAVCFICAFFEGVLLSITHAYVAIAVKDGKKYGELLEHLKENVDRPISAILTMNTISNTLGSAAIGAP